MASEPSGRRTKAPDEQELLAAACGIMAVDGWAGLTLRPLAQRLGVSVTVLSNHYGTRSDVVAAICRAACASEQRIFAGWQHTLERLVRLSPSLAAELADAILEELAVGQRAFSLLFIEMVQASGWDADLRGAFAPWRAARMRFWSEFGRCAGLADALAGSGWLAGYCVDELVYSIVLNHIPSYRLLRRLGLRRLFAGVGAGAGAAEDAAMLAILFDDIEYGAGELAVVHGKEVSTGWPGRAARACAVLLTEGGVSALTHRAIAAQAGVPHTTLSYRFATQQDLVVAGLEYIIAHLLQAVDSKDAAAAPSTLQALIDKNEGDRIDVGRATFALAIAAARMPTLVSCAADMRRRRGINLVKILRQVSPALPGIDLLAAQTVSIGLIGLVNTVPPGAAATALAETVYSAILAQLRKKDAADHASLE